MSNLRVLLADSDTTFRTNAQRAFTRQGDIVIPAANIIDALTLLSADDIDVVIVDAKLPGGDGQQLLRAARSKSSAMPVILLAEPSELDDAEAGISLGASACLVKPVEDFAPLLEIVAEFANRPSITTPEIAADPPTVEGEAEAGAAARFLEALTAGQELGELLSAFAKELAELAGSKQSLVLLSHNDGQLHIAAAFGFADSSEASRALASTNAEEFAYRVAAAKKSVASGMRSNEKPESGALPGVKAFIGMPLLYSKEVLGVAIIFASGGKDLLPSVALEEMHRLTQQASLAVELFRARGLAERRNPTDALTGLYNRHHFFELAEREFRRSWRFGERIAALQLDVDQFSRLRLLISLTESDGAMRDVARSVHTHVRNIDIVGRLDADKLGILLLNCTRDLALQVAERLRREVAQIELSTSEGQWQVTASIGLATYPREQCASVHDLFGLCAQAARAAERAGHNRVVGV